MKENLFAEILRIETDAEIYLNNKRLFDENLYIFDLPAIKAPFFISEDKIVLVKSRVEGQYQIIEDQETEEYHCGGLMYDTWLDLWFLEENPLKTCYGYESFICFGSIIGVCDPNEVNNEFIDFRSYN